VLVQDVMLELSKFWTERGCVLQQPYDLEVGAGTFHPATFLGVLGPASDGSVGEGALIQSGVEVCDGGYYEYYSE